jgi:protein TonB
MKKIIVFLFLFYSIDNFSQSVEKQGDNTIYDIVGIDVKPVFPEGLEKLNSYINNELLNAGFEKQEKTKTKVKANIFSIFVVEKDGSLSDIKILGKVDSRKSEELIKILKSLQKWNPGKQNGINVRVLYALPLHF